MENDFKVVDTKVFIPDDYLQKIQYILKDKFVLRMEFNKKIEGNYIRTKLLYYFIEEFIKFYKEDSKSRYLESVHTHFEPEVKRELERLYGSFNMLDDRVNDLDDVKEVIELCLTFKKAERLAFLLRELIEYKDDILKDMAEYKSQDEIDAFIKEYDDAIDKKNIDKMEDMVARSHDEILKEWEKYVSNYTSMSEDDFLFIGHSTQDPETWEKNVSKKDPDADIKDLFRSRYVSCSLFSPSSIDTYRSGYGFIMSPNKIVGAQSEDMSIDNYTSTVSGLKSYTKFPKINHPKRIIKELEERKRLNQEENSDRKVYSEIVIDGFEPIGIFCFTTGIIDKDSSLVSAMKLKSCFPNLDVKVIDLFKVKKGDELRSLEVQLINKFTNNSGPFYACNVVTLQDLPRYRRFLDDFYTLKAKGDVHYDDLKKAFDKNKELLSELLINETTLFDGRFNHEDIKFILGNNPKYNIDYILSGSIDVHSLSLLKDLYPCRAKLDKYYPGLGIFVELLNRFVITYEDVEAFIESKDYSFDNFSRIFKSNVENRLISKKDEKEALVEADMASYNALIDERSELQAKKQKYDDSFFILSNAPWKPIILNDIKDLNQEIVQMQVKYTKLDNEKRILENQLSQLMNDHNIEKDKSFIKTPDIIKLEEKVVALDAEIEDLSSTLFKRVVNKGKIKMKQDEASLARDDINRQVQNFEKNQQHLLSVSEFRIELVTSRLNEIEEKMRECDYTIRHDKDRVKVATKTLLEYFKVDSIDRIDDAIAEAKRYINEEYDSSTMVRLSMIEKQIDELAQRIAYQNNEIIAIDQEIKGMSL